MEYTIVCISCGESFVLSDAEAEWYLAKGYNLPRRCFTCRQRRKLAQTDYLTQLEVEPVPEPKPEPVPEPESVLEPALRVVFRPKRVYVPLKVFAAVPVTRGKLSHANAMHHLFYDDKDTSVCGAYNKKRVYFTDIKLGIPEDTTICKTCMERYTK